MAEGTMFDLEKLTTRMNDYYPLIKKHEERCKKWFTGAGLGMFIHCDHTSAQEIAKLAKEAGMAYVVFTSKHHNG